MSTVASAVPTVVTASCSKNAVEISQRLASSNVRHRTELLFTYNSTERATQIERALRPELGEIDDDRSETQLERTAATLELTVVASDLVALRAGVNTWCSLVSVAERATGES